MKRIQANIQTAKVRYPYHNSSFKTPKSSHVHIFEGSMVPFGLRMLNAELPLYLARSEESISNLYKLLSTTDGVIKELGDDESTYQSYASVLFLSG